MQGYRQYMEDRYIFANFLEENAFLAAVLDGHGGSEVVNLTKNTFADKITPKVSKIFESSKDEAIEILTEFFYEYDAYLKKSLSNTWHRSGTTFTGILMNNSDVIVMNVGDSKTFLLNKKEINFEVNFHFHGHSERIISTQRDAQASLFFPYYYK